MTDGTVTEERNWVFAYGSNMDLGHLREWFQQKALGVPQVLHLAVASLPGHRLVWNYYSDSRGSGAANVEPAISRVHGLLLEVTGATLKGLDRKEGHPNRYRRVMSTCEIWSGETRPAWVYIAEPAHRSTDFIAPAKAYRDLLLAAARRHGFPAAYTEALEQLDTVD